MSGLASPVTHPARRRSPWIPLALIATALVPAATAPVAIAEPAPPSEIPATVPVAEVMAEPVSRALDPQAWPHHLDLEYPLARLALQRDPWGWRYSTARGRWRMHTGLDLAADAGTAVLASLPGRVLLAEPVGDYGLTVLLDHGGGLQTLYAHLRSAAVQPGAWLERGQALGAVGMSGSATGPHLHFEVRQRGTQLLALDPTPHLPPPALPALPGLLAAQLP